MPRWSRGSTAASRRSTGTLEVIDLDSTNGTYVNDERVDRATLESGDRLRLGRIELKVEQKSDQSV